jgi:pimeloyl-ACP methyl ester carboxylesterase
MIARVDQWLWPRNPGDDETAGGGLRAIRTAKQRVFRLGRYRHVSVLTADASGAHVAVLFIPGAGGQAEQFYKQAQLFMAGAELGRTIGVFYSHHGHGPNARECYSWKDLSAVALTEQAVDMYNFALDQIAPANRERAKVVIAAHSYGCAITVCALHKMPRVAGIILMAPPIPRHQGWVRWILLQLPSWFLDLVRLLDRRGGVRSKSVCRMVGWNGRGADPTLAHLQLRKSWSRRQFIGEVHSTRIHGVETDHTLSGLIFLSILT